MGRYREAHDTGDRHGRGGHGSHRWSLTALHHKTTTIGQLLFGEGVSAAGKALARVADIALLALGVACWPRREAGSGSAHSTGAMLTYSLLVTIYLVYLGGIVHLAGMLLWPGVAVHAGWMLLLVAAWRHSGSARADQPCDARSASRLHSDACGSSHPNSSSNPLASWRSAVSKPSVNQL